ncbi:MAG: hypothetical protein ABFS56_06085 [Pseudomonadota bacterium]
MMKLIQHTPTQLILKHRPIAYWLIGSFFTIMGVVIIILFSKASTFTCEQVQLNQGSCELKHSYGFIMSETLRIPIQEITGTEVVMNHTRGVDSFFFLQPHYQLILLTPTEKIPLSHYGTISREKQDIMADQINAFLNDHNETLLVIKRDNRWMSLLIGSIFIIVGMFAQLRRIITVTFDKAVGSLKIERQGLLGTQVNEHPLENITEVKLNTSSYFNSKTVLYQAVLVLSSGENLLLTFNSSMGKARKQKLVDEMTNFLNK